MKLRFSEKATFQLRDIRNHIAKDNPPAAKRVVAAIRRSIDTLMDFPESHPASGDDARELIVPRLPYVVVYRLGPGAIDILGVFHTSRDPSIRSRA